MIRTRELRLAAAGLMVCLTAGLAACDDGADMDLDTETTPAMGDVATNDVDIEEVRLGRAVGADMRITDDINEFTVGDSVYVSVRLEGTANAVPLTARWLTEDDSLIHEEIKTISPAGEQWAWFSLATESLPEGDYELKLFVNGDEDESRDFSIQRRSNERDS
jgi:hypothetical protein